MLSEGQNGGDDDRHGDRHVHDDEPLRRELRLWRLQENNENIDQINGWRNHKLKSVTSIKWLAIN